MYGGRDRFVLIHTYLKLVKKKKILKNPYNVSYAIFSLCVQIK